MLKDNSYHIPDFINIQRNNFQEFLKSGIISEIENHNEITNETTGLTLRFYPNYYQFCRSENSIKNAITNGRTYACRLYLPAELIDKNKKVSHFQWILLGTIPLMNRRGHFILNGSPRVIINQMVRSPGIYYADSIDRKNRRTVYADLISQRGTWLRFEMDGDGTPYVRMKRTPKIPLPLLLVAMGLNISTITQRLSNIDWFQNSNYLGYDFGLIKDGQGPDKKNNQNYTMEEWALISLYALTHPKRELVEITPDMGKKFLFRKFLNPRTYDLGRLGRQRLNQRFNLNTPITHGILTTEDIFKIIEELNEVFLGNAAIDDIDHLKNRRIRASGELIQNQLAIGLTRFEKVVRERFRRPTSLLNLSNLVTTKPVNASFREFFGSSQLSQFLDQTNPLAEITHKRRFTSLGPSGVSRETAGMAIRGIHPTHYGRICPIETPEGQNAGLVNSPATFTRINPDGLLESPFRKVFKGQAQNEIFYLSADQEENYFVAPGDLKIDQLSFLDNKILPSRKQQDFWNIKSTSIDFLALSSLQMISVATSLIPFFEHDDANRALMGSNMQRQAVPLLKPEKPIVGTGYEPRVVADCGHTINARFSGYVTFISCQEIQIYSLVPQATTNTNLIPKLTNNENVLLLDQIQPNNLSARNQYKFETISYKLESISRSNQDTYQFERPLVQEGQWVEKGDVLADGSASSDGELSLGKNILIGYLPWEGYNFEDAILISERLVQQDLYTSLHVEKYDFEVKETRFGKEQLTKNIPDVPNISKEKLNQQGIIKLGSWVQEGDILVGKITPIHRKPLTPHERLLYDIVGKNVQDVKDTSLRVPKGLVARVVKIRIFDEDGNCYENSLPNNQSIFTDLESNSITFDETILSKRRTKKSFRYWKKLRKNNAKQICLAQTNLSNKTLLENELVKTNPSIYPVKKFIKKFDAKLESELTTPFKKEIQRVQIFLAEKRRVQVGDKMAGRHGNKGIISRILPQADMPYLPDGTPLDLVLNPLGVPSRMNVGQIYECLLGFAGSYLNENYKILPFDEVVGAQMSRSLVYSKLYKARTSTKNKWLFDPNFPGKVKLFDGRTGEAFDQRVTVGQSYILKLVHQVDEKIHARSTGPYSLVTQQPLRGRSKHGGQRLGEMEVWALEGFGAAYTLQELLTVKSDDMKGRHQVMNAILANIPMQLGTPESFKVLVRELQSLCLDIGVFAITEKGYRRPIDILRLP